MIKRNFSEITPILNEDRSMLIYEAMGIAAAIKNEHFSLAKILLKPGSTIVQHFHRESEETYIIISGSGLMTINDKSFRVQMGDVIYIMPEERHQVSTSDLEELEFLAITRPPYDPSDFLTD